MSKYKWWLVGLGVAILAAVAILWVSISHAQCTAKYDAGTVVTLTATPCPGWKFKVWTGACAGQGKVCKITMDGDKATEAVFTKIPNPKNLRITKALEGQCLAGQQGYTK